MTVTDCSAGLSAISKPTRWLAAIAAGLATGGVCVELNRARAGLTLTAIHNESAQGDVTVTFQAEGHAQIDLWISHSVTPAEITAALMRAMTALGVVADVGPQTASLGSSRPSSGRVAGHEDAVTQGTGHGDMSESQDQEQTAGADRAPSVQTNAHAEADRGSAPDVPRVSQSDPGMDFAERLKRLPPNHPSSPSGRPQ